MVGSILLLLWITMINYGNREMWLSDLAVISNADKLCGYIFQITEKSPKKFRFTFITRMQNLSLDVIENLRRANAVYVRGPKDRKRIEKRQSYQTEASVALMLLNDLTRIAREAGCILPKQHLLRR